MRRFFSGVKEFFRRIAAKLSFRTGVVILILCLLFYLLSFAQMLLPISATAKSTLWVILFGMAKATQYLGLAIVGVEGWQRIISYFRRKKSAV